jgi:hypothetical protein
VTLVSAPRSIVPTVDGLTSGNLAQRPDCVVRHFRGYLGNAPSARDDDVDRIVGRLQCGCRFNSAGGGVRPYIRQIASQVYSRVNRPHIQSYIIGGRPISLAPDKRRRIRLKYWNSSAPLGLKKREGPMTEEAMPRGDKSSYTDKQKRQAGHIEEGYEKRGVSEDEAERRAWATVNKTTHGGKKSGSGRGEGEDHSPARKGGRLGGKASAQRPASERSRAAKKAARTRKRRAA